MAHLAGLVISHDEAFRSEVAALLRSGPIPASAVDESAVRQGTPPDLVVYDARGDWPAVMAAVERSRSAFAGAGVFIVAQAADPTLILEAMRAGANEFFTWPLSQEAVHEAIRRTTARRESAPGAKKGGTTLVFFGAKGGTGTTTLSVNCAVDLARVGKKSTVIVDLRAGLGEVALFLGVRPKYSLLDGIDNLHRLDAEFLRELVVKHKSGLDILAGSDQFDRPAAGDSHGIEELVRFLSRQYDYVVIDAGCQVSACSVAALYSADHIMLVATPDVPSIRNSQRLLDHVRQLGACGERVRFLLNRASEPLPIPLKHIEGAVGFPVHHMFPSDYKTVSAALNAGVPLALSGNSEIAEQFDRFTRRILNPDADVAGAPPKSTFGLARVASLW